jgi:G:T-mismatch repair DNA endonuclease (very short patch repair protein)
LHVHNLPGRPDIVLLKYGVAVFVHGCFWHGHSCPRGRQPTSNRTFWVPKLEANIARDERSRAALQKLGWRVFVIWECSLEAGTSELVTELNALRSLHQLPCPTSSGGKSRSRRRGEAGQRFRSS